ncbi:MAG: PilN domain-containing protein [Pseudomonadota bacterium]
MKPMRIDFAAPSWRRTLFHLHPAAIAGAVIGLALCAGAAVTAYDMLEQRNARAQLLQQLQRRQAAQLKTPVIAASTAIPEAQARAVNAAILQLNLPWRDLQEALAAATPPAVALLALEPDPRKQVLKITAEAKNADDMIGYIEQLKGQEFFSGAALTRHEVNQQDANRPLRFQLEVRWRAQ